MAKELIPSKASLPDGQRERFDPRRAAEFAERSVSAETRRAYNRVVWEFFASTGNLAPAAIAVGHVQAWRDGLLRRRQKAATVSFKLAVLRAFFGYLIALNLLEKNPADGKFVSSPRLPENMTGRALTSEEVRKLLAGPDRSRPEALATTLCCS